MTGRTLWWTRWAKGSRRPLLPLTMSLSGASASAAAKQRHQEQRRADTSALADAARWQRQMPELPPYVPEFDLAFMSQMLGVGAVRSEPEDPATGDDETIMQEAAVDIPPPSRLLCLVLLTPLPAIPCPTPRARAAALDRPAPLLGRSG